MRLGLCLAIKPKLDTLLPLRVPGEHVFANGLPARVVMLGNLQTT